MSALRCKPAGLPDSGRQSCDDPGQPHGPHAGFFVQRQVSNNHLSDGPPRIRMPSSELVEVSPQLMALDDAAREHARLCAAVERPCRNGGRGESLL